MMGPTKTPGASAPQGRGDTSTRKAWKKKTPAEVVLDQVNKLREDVAKKEAELNEAKRQLKKLEEAQKVLEGA